MVARPAEDEAVQACLATLEATLAGSSPETDSLDAFAPEMLEAALGALAQQRGDDGLRLVTALAEGRGGKQARKAARRVLYRLSQAGVALPAPAAPPKPVVRRGAAKALSAWVSGVDGTGSRAVWILFEGGFGELALCALILNDQVGILESAGGPISKKRLESELRSLRQSQKLPWVELLPGRAVALVAEALALHARLATAPPAEFARWRPFLGDAPQGEPAPPVSAEADPSLLGHSAELLHLPELASWFLDPGALESDALELLQARESRLVLSDQLKAEREAAIVERVVERVFTPDARRLWARRLAEMAWILDATGRPREARIAHATARALDDSERAPGRIPFARGLAERGLAFAAEVALGRVSAAEVSRAPRRS